MKKLLIPLLAWIFGACITVLPFVVAIDVNHWWPVLFVPGTYLSGKFFMLYIIDIWKV